MRGVHAGVYRSIIVAVILAVLASALLMGARLRQTPATLVLEVSSARLPANGVATGTVQLHASDGRRLRDAHIELANANRGQIEVTTQEGHKTTAVLRAGTLPGPILIIGRATGLPPVTTKVEGTLDTTDSGADGTPDFLRLEDEADRIAFRRWFTYLVEDEFFRTPGEMPAEINDCAALIRFAYRESLRAHDGGWATGLRLKSPGANPPVRKYQYPFTAVGAGLFRVRAGRFLSDDASDGTFAQFADANALRRYNTHFVSRDLRRARPGDLLLFRQLEQRMPFHAMVFVGRSQFTADANQWIVYHTGPTHGLAGEMRRLTTNELLQYPLPQWRPTPENPGFLGIYRWNILRGPS